MLAAEQHPAADAFLDAIEAVCRQYGWSISHEDGQGAFIVEPLNETHIAWLRAALLDASVPDQQAPLFANACLLCGQPPEAHLVGTTHPFRYPHPSR